MTAADKAHRGTTKSVPDFCRSQLCTVVHGHAVCNGRDRKKQPKFKNLGVEYLATNQGVVGSSPAGRAKFLKGLQRCSPFDIYRLCRKRAVGRTLHGAHGAQAVRVRGQLFSRKVCVPPHHLLTRFDRGPTHQGSIVSLNAKKQPVSCRLQR